MSNCYIRMKWDLDGPWYQAHSQWLSQCSHNLLLVKLEILLKYIRKRDGDCYFNSVTLRAELHHLSLPIASCPMRGERKGLLARPPRDLASGLSSTFSPQLFTCATSMDSGTVHCAHYAESAQARSCTSSHHVRSFQLMLIRTATTW